MRKVMVVEDVDVLIEGKGEETIVMIHGWPDTYRLWDDMVEELKKDYRCVRFTLPGFDINKSRRLYTLQEEVEIFDKIINAVSPDKKVILLLHDWGCVFGYQYYMLNKEKVSRVIGLDVADANSKEMKLPLPMKLFAAGYQLFLALAWHIGGKLGDGMTRWMAKKLNVRSDINLIHSGMNYAYHLRWKAILTRKPQGTIDIDPECPMLFMYGKNKPTMFHSQSFLEKLGKKEGCKILELDAGHWVMLDKPIEVQSMIRNWIK